MKLLLIILGLGFAQAAQVFQVRPKETELPNVLSDELVVSVHKTRSFQKPTCTVGERNGSCCIVIDIMSRSYNTCVELSYSNDGGLKLHAGLKFNNATIIKKDIAVGKICSPLPIPIATLLGCLDVYYADVDVNNRSADACFLVEIGVPFGGSLLQVRFDCYRFQDGKLERHAEVTAPSSGILSVGLSDGKPSISFNKPALSLPKLPSAITNLFG